jgi:Fe(3+) dicitrate transport protein
LNYQLNDKTLHFDYTYFNYLAQQAGGLTDVMFNQTRHRAIDLETGLQVDWNLFALKLEHKFNNDADFSYSYLA